MLKRDSVWRIEACAAPNGILRKMREEVVTLSLKVSKNLSDGGGVGIKYWGYIGVGCLAAHQTGNNQRNQEISHGSKLKQHVVMLVAEYPHRFLD